MVQNSRGSCSGCRLSLHALAQCEDQSPHQYFVVNVDLTATCQLSPAQQACVRLRVIGRSFDSSSLAGHFRAPWRCSGHQQSAINARRCAQALCFQRLSGSCNRPSGRGYEPGSRSYVFFGSPRPASRQDSAELTWCPCYFGSWATREVRLDRASALG